MRSRSSASASETDLGSFEVDGSLFSEFEDSPSFTDDLLELCSLGSGAFVTMTDRRCSCQGRKNVPFGVNSEGEVEDKD